MLVLAGRAQRGNWLPLWTPGHPDSVRPAPQAHSGTRPVTDAKKTRSAQTGFLLYAVTGLRSSTHSNGEDAALMALVHFHGSMDLTLLWAGSCGSLPAGDPSPGEEKERCESREASFEPRNLFGPYCLAFRNSQLLTRCSLLFPCLATPVTLPSAASLRSDRLQASSHRVVPGRGRAEGNHIPASDAGRFCQTNR